ncbi:MAG: peptidase S10 [Anaerolineae bacterium]
MPDSTSSTSPTPQDTLVVTHHSVTINGQNVPYTVTTGTLVLKEEAEKSGDEAGASDGEKPKASMFFIAYTRDDVDDPTSRPLTFSFNGGPGSSSVWMHLGLLGPKRVLLDKDGFALRPPFRLVENDASLLDVTDLVFIDPVSTGYSRPVPGEKAKDFHNYTKDVESVGDFIRLYTTRYRRWLSPKFLIGESYGTTRAAGLSGYLQERHGLWLNGIMLVSSILNFQTANFNPGNDLPYLLFLPTFAATAWYHRRLPVEQQSLSLHEFLKQVESFATGEYAAALFHGDTLPSAQRQAIAERLAQFTGLSVEYLERTNLRIDIFRFIKELMRSERRTVGRLDSRYTGLDRDAAGESLEFDPSYAAVQGAYTACFNDYVRGDLGYESDLPYEILKGLYETWSYKEFENQYVNVAETLRQAMSMNPHLLVHVANGYYDLATPYFATQYTFNHLSLDPSLAGHISMSYYEAGHMMYVHLPSLYQLKAELASFVQTTSGLS